MRIMITFRYTKWTEDEQDGFVEQMAGLLCSHIVRTLSKQLVEDRASAAESSEIQKDIVSNSKERKKTIDE